MNRRILYFRQALLCWVCQAKDGASASGTDRAVSAWFNPLSILFVAAIVPLPFRYRLTIEVILTHFFSQGKRLTREAAMKNTIHFVRDSIGLGQEIPCANLCVGWINSYVDTVHRRISISTRAPSPGDEAISS